jgi:hypothetical protein
MSGLGVTLYSDEDVDPALAVHLRQDGYDALSTHEAGRANQRISDEDQLVYAAQQGRTLLTFNVRDFVHLDREWKAANKKHHGIVVSPRIEALGELLRRVQQHLDSVSPAQQDNVFLWLRA